MNNVRRIRIEDAASWENIAIDGLMELYDIHGVQISETEVIIAGKSSDETYRVDLIKNKCFKDSKLVSSAYFDYTMAPVILGGNAYFTDDGRNIHIYNIKERKWETA